MSRFSTTTPGDRLLLLTQGPRNVLLSLSGKNSGEGFELAFSLALPQFSGFLFERGPWTVEQSYLEVHVGART